MSALWDWLDSISRTVLVFGTAWAFFLAISLVLWAKTRPRAEICERCGAEWKITDGGGGLYHYCTPPWRRTIQ